MEFFIQDLGDTKFTCALEKMILGLNDVQQAFFVYIIFK